AVAVVHPAAGNHVFEEPVAFDVHPVDARRDRAAQWPCDAPFEAAEAVIADINLTADFGLKPWLGGDNRNEARRRVAAEQCALRPAQNLDPVERPKLGEADAGARPVNAVDENADRAFEPGIVAHGADA